MSCHLSKLIFQLLIVRTGGIADAKQQNTYGNSHQGWFWKENY